MRASPDHSRYQDQKKTRKTRATAATNLRHRTDKPPRTFTRTDILLYINLFLFKILYRNLKSVLWFFSSEHFFSWNTMQEDMVFRLIYLMLG
jgi:hypothetical protein